MRPERVADPERGRHRQNPSFAGGFSDRAPPVPIPNTAVKPISAHGTAGATLWKSRSSPALYLASRASTEARGAYCLGGGPLAALPVRCRHWTGWQPDLGRLKGVNETWDGWETQPERNASNSLPRWSIWIASMGSPAMAFIHGGPLSSCRGQGRLAGRAGHQSCINTPIPLRNRRNIPCGVLNLPLRVPLVRLGKAFPK